MNTKHESGLFLAFALLVIIFLFLLSNINYIHGIKDYKQNTTLAFRDYNFTAVEDWCCNKEYSIIQESKFGFLNINIENNGKKILGEFYTNERNIIDHFELKEA